MIAFANNKNTQAKEFVCVCVFEWRDDAIFKWRKRTKA